MDILKNERQFLFAAIALAWFADGARRRIHPERLVIGAAVVVTREPEACGRPENQQGRGVDEPARPPRWIRTQPRVLRIAEQNGRIEGRKVRTILVVLTLERRPGRVDDE